MSNIYAVCVVRISTLRDSKLANILSGEENKLSLSDVEYFFNKGNRLEKKLSNSIKLYKTIGGANNLIKLLNHKYSNSIIKLNSAVYDQTLRRYNRDFLFDTSLFQLVNINVTKDWNKIIDEEISKVEKDYLNKLNKLKAKKISI